MAGSTVFKTTHFVLHRVGLDIAADRLTIFTGPQSVAPKALFSVREVWIGALVPKRWAKRAVTRNAIKRQIYTVSQDFEPLLPAAAHVVRLRAVFNRNEFVSASSVVLKRVIRLELQQLFAGARK